MLLGVPKRALIIAGVLAVVAFVVANGGVQKMFAGFVSGPCHVTVISTLAKVRAALARVKGGEK